MTFVKAMCSQNTGGSIMCDMLTLDDGTVLIISEELIALYQDHETWEDRSTEILGEIFRVALMD